jgi:hypothetical protein
MIALVEADQVDFIVVEEHTRWGYKDIYEFYEHMALLRKHRVILFEARTGRILNPHPSELGGIIISSVQSVQSHQETANLAARSLKAKLIKAQQGQWGGGPIPYALAVACRTHQGDTLWVAEQIGEEHFEQHYPDGTSRILTYFPTDRDEKTEFLYLVPSRHQGRIEAVKLIFELVQDDPAIALSEITRRLLKRGYKTASGRLWRYTLVHSILSQPAYTGHYYYAKQSKARHHTQTNGTEMKALLEPENNHKPRESWIKGPQIFPAIVTEEQWQAAQAYLQNYTPRRAKDERLWLSGILYCPNGHKLHGWFPENSHQPVPKYICNAYRKKHECDRPYTVKHEQVAKLVLEYLGDIGADLEDISLKSLYERKGRLRRRWQDLRACVDGILYEKLAEVFHYEQRGQTRVFEVPLPDGDTDIVQIPGSTNVEYLLEWVSSAEGATSGERLAEMREQHARITASFPEATPGIRRELARQALRLETEMARISEGIGSVAGELREVFREMSQLSYEIGRARRAGAALDNKTLGDIIHRVIERVDCDYETATYPSGYSVSRLKGVKITPRLGSPEHRTIRPDGTHRRRCRSPTRRCKARRWRPRSGS